MTIEQGLPDVLAAEHDRLRGVGQRADARGGAGDEHSGRGVLLLSAAKTGNPWLLAGCSIYAATMIAVYAASTLSHFVADARRRRFFRSLDQAFIYTFIVGTYTPFLAGLPALGVRGGYCWG